MRAANHRTCLAYLTPIAPSIQLLTFVDSFVAMAVAGHANALKLPPKSEAVKPPPQNPTLEALSSARIAEETDILTFRSANNF